MTGAGATVAPIVRAAAPADARRIAEVNVRSWQATYRGIVPSTILDGMNVEPQRTTWLGRIADLGQRSLFVAELDGRVEGYALSGPSRDHDLPELAGEVYAIYVDPPAQRQGLGRALLDAASTELRSAGFDPLVLWVLTANVHGRGFYEACRWEPDGTSRPIDFDGTPVDELRYRSP
ncbi:MAG TPA: GNAT family N-acetyltransferase [Candidatus Limnocylindrales bacterium]|nr:GNAT family N-acetyltransferase [Candidatus Limnocylindrales bacterium]